MRAVVYTESGDSSVLELVERAVQEPGPGEVRVRVVRAGVNPTDWKFRSGGLGELAFPEVVPGQDGAGIVDAVGAGVHTLARGDRVWIMLAQHERPRPHRASSSQDLRGRSRPARARRARRAHGPRSRWCRCGPPVLQAASEDITAALADGAFGVGEQYGLPLHHFPLERTAEAHAAVEAGAIGKVLIDVGQDRGREHR